jgi:hypothetical protein
MYCFQSLESDKNIPITNGERITPDCWTNVCPQNILIAKQKKTEKEITKN